MRYLQALQVVSHTIGVLLVRLQRGSKQRERDGEREFGRGWTDGWTDEWMDGWMDRLREKGKDGYMDE